MPLIPNACILSLVFLSFQLFTPVFGQNDECADALPVSPQFTGYNLGTFTSSVIDLSQADANLNEHFTKSHNNIGLNKKSVWFKVVVPVRRAMTITIKQRDTAIAQNAVGFAVYATQQCYPNPLQLAGSFPVITKFGSASNSCVKPGEYLIQVVANEKANDSIWLETAVGYSTSSNAHDAHQDAYTLNNPTQHISTTQKTGCLSLDNGEEIGLPDSMNQSFWVTFKKAPAFNEFMFSLRNRRVDSFQAMYIFYTGNVRQGMHTLDTLEKHKTKNYRNLNVIKRCKDLGANKWYSLQIILHNNTAEDLDLLTAVNARTGAKSANPSSIHPSNDTVVSRSMNIRMSDVVTCESLIKSNKCQSTDQDYYVIERRRYNGSVMVSTFDTLRYQIWAKVELKKPAFIEMLNNRPYRSKLQVYKGDISKECDLDLYDPDKGCWDAGVYSLQLLVEPPSEYYANVRDVKRMLGNQMSMWLEIAVVPPQGPAVYSTPAKTNIFSISPTAYGYKGQSKYDSLISPFRSFTIKGQKYTGRFNFHAFKIPAKGKYDIKMNATRYCATHAFLFKGSSANGLHTLSEIPGHGVVRLGENTDSLEDNDDYSFYCPELEVGEWYTAMVVYPVDTPCFPYSCATEIEIDENIVYNDTVGNYPHKPILVNDGKPLSYSKQNRGTTEAPNHMETYKVDGVQITCSRKHSKQFYNCIKYYLTRQPMYYYFTIDKEATVHIDSRSLKRLYPFDARTADSVKLKDPNEMIASCKNGQYYCKLQPGDYTLVLMQFKDRRQDTINYSYRIDLEIQVDRVEDAKNTFAQTSHNLGLIPAEGAKETPGEYASCLTEKMIRLNKQNTNMEYGYDGVLWYTFQTAGTGNITVSVEELTRQWGHAESSFTIYRSMEKGNGTFAEFKRKGYLDSTESSRFIEITRQRRYDPKTYTFESASCDTVRYFVLLNPYRVANPFNYRFRVKVEYEDVQYNLDEGDYCHNAKLLNVGGVGSFSATLKPNCHSMGEGFGEDGSNMSCLGDTAGSKTSWFKIAANTQDTFDLSLELVNSTNQASEDIKYRMFYGSCASLTPAICVGNAKASFKLDCMVKGNYYIQVLSPELATGEITLRAILTSTEYASCNLVDPDDVLANFKALGGCQHDDLKVNNLSSQGDQISYKWYLDGVYETDDLAPTWKIKALSRIDTHMLSLAVFNTTPTLSGYPFPF